MARSPSLDTSPVIDHGTKSNTFMEKPATSWTMEKNSVTTKQQKKAKPQNHEAHLNNYKKQINL